MLTGGRSTRMGRDKATLVVGGEALAARTARVLEEAGAESVVAVGGDPAVLGLGGLGLAVLADLHPGEGPLGAIVTALGALPPSIEVVVVLACDLWLVEPEAVRAVVDALDGAPASAMAAMARSPDGAAWEPLLAAYRRSAAATLGEAFAAGERVVQRSLAGLEVVEVVLADPTWLSNANRPGDLGDQGGHEGRG